MTQSDGGQLEQAPTYASVRSVEKLEKFNQNILTSFSLFHWIGYGLLILAVFDLVVLLIPPRLLNPIWEFQVFGQLVERVPVPLIGLILVFFGERRARANWEYSSLSLLSWLALLAALFMLLLMPLSIVNTVRIDQQSRNQIATRVNPQLEQLAAVQQQLDQISTPTELEEFLSGLTQDSVPSIEDPDQLETIKGQIQSRIENNVAAAESQVKATVSGRRLTLIKNAVKWNLGALVSSVLFFTIWKNTSWARQRYVRRY